MKLDYGELLKELSREELIAQVEFLADSWWNLQGNWMQNVSERFGSETAAELDGIVFGRAGEVQAKRLKKIYNLGDDIEALAKAINLSTLLSNVEFEYIQIDKKHCRLRITKCNMQLGRLASGLSELPCKVPGTAANARFASAINPRIRTTCIVCPPDSHPEDIWCEWQFDLMD